MEIFQLNDFETGESLGIVIVTLGVEYTELISERWKLFHMDGDHDFDLDDVDGFVEWYNSLENNLSTIERVFLTEIN
jgi:hypothetical protein